MDHRCMYTGMAGTHLQKASKATVRNYKCSLFFILQDMYLNSSGKTKRGTKQAEKIERNRGV